jgi:hypothetical protein
MIVNNELEMMWNEIVVASLGYYPSICLEELGKATRNLRIIISQPR